MKRERDPNKPRRKFKPTGSPGRQMLAKQHRRLMAIDPDAGGILAQALALLGDRKRGRRA